MTDTVYIASQVIPAAPGTKLLRVGKEPLPIVGWRVGTTNYASPIAARAPAGMTIVVPGADGDEISTSTAKRTPQSEE